MILIIDNYDSFTYNLVHLAAGQLADEAIEVYRNDAISLDEIGELAPRAIILSPGPGHPDQAGICIPLVQRFAGRIPILGICLGHQAIAKAFGGTIRPARKLVHGRPMTMKKTTDCILLEGLEQFEAARYHSLAVTELPDCLQVTALCEGEIMAIAHKDYAVYGLQFHPESIMTPCGDVIMHNFLKGALLHD